jgi:hypothetical protein
MKNAKKGQYFTMVYSISYIGEKKQHFGEKKPDFPRSRRLDIYAGTVLYWILIFPEVLYENP